jgi:hypothetical protein
MASCLWVVMLPQPAHAEVGRVRLHANAVGGFGGEVEEDAEGPRPEYPYGSSGEFHAGNELFPSYGGALGFDVALLPHFALGAELALSAWNSKARASRDGGEKPNLQLDILLRPRVRFSLGERLELYLVMPLGLTHFFPPTGETWTLSGTRASRIDGGTGPAIGAGLGITYFVLEHFGLAAEVGYLYRNFGGTVVEKAGNYVVRDLEETLSFAQAQVRLGISVAF